MPVFELDHCGLWDRTNVESDVTYELSRYITL